MEDGGFLRKEARGFAIYTYLPLELSSRQRGGKKEEQLLYQGSLSSTDVESESPFQASVRQQSSVRAHDRTSDPSTPLLAQKRNNLRNIVGLSHPSIRRGTGIPTSAHDQRARERRELTSPARGIHGIPLLR